MERLSGGFEPGIARAGKMARSSCDVQEKVVAGIRVLYVQTSLKRKPASVDGCEDLSWSDLPEAVQNCAQHHGWEQFGRVGQCLVAGPNKASRLTAAKVALESEGIASSPRDHERSMPSDAAVQLREPKTPGRAEISARDGEVYIRASEDCKGGVDSIELLEYLNSVSSLGLPSFKVRLCLQNLWWSTLVCQFETICWP